MANAPDDLNEQLRTEKLPIITMRPDQLARLRLLAEGSGQTIPEYVRALVSAAWRKRTEHERYLARKDRAFAQRAAEASRADDDP